MYPRRAVVFALDTIVRPMVDDDGYHWVFDPRLPGLLRDCRATGHRVFGMLDPSAFGLLIENDRDREALARYINDAMKAAGVEPFDDLHITDNVGDPTPLWGWRRRFGFALSAVTVVGAGAGYEQLRRNAGLSGQHLEPNNAEELFNTSHAIVY